MQLLASGIPLTASFISPIFNRETHDADGDGDDDSLLPDDDVGGGDDDESILAMIPRRS